MESGALGRRRSGRFVSRLTRGTLAIIMAGVRGERLKHLTLRRCKPATPFGGKFRIIDFVLSNCVNSGIRQIAILTQYKAQSLSAAAAGGQDHAQDGDGSSRINSDLPFILLPPCILCCLE